VVAEIKKTIDLSENGRYQNKPYLNLEESMAKLNVTLNSEHF
jgi:hypothetical protein